MKLKGNPRRMGPKAQKLRGVMVAFPLVPGKKELETLSGPRGTGGNG